jgi:MYXO-CTERM domain-containing protein
MLPIQFSHCLHVVVALACIGIGPIVAASAAPPIQPGLGQRWTPTLVEDFDGPSLNTAIWTVRDVDNRPNGNNGVTWGWDPANVSIDDGKLVIQTTADGDGTYSSGNIWTKDKWSQTYGYFEARIKIPPTASGRQAAFWMTAQDNGHFTVGDGGRDGAEIDIMETPDASDHYRTGLHWDGYGSEHQSVGAQHSRAFATATTTSGSTGMPIRSSTTTTATQAHVHRRGRAARGRGDPGLGRHPRLGRRRHHHRNVAGGHLFRSHLCVAIGTEDSITVVDDESDAITYIGNGWQPKGNSQDYLGTMSQSGAAGDAVEFEFNGTAVDVFIRKGLYGGIVDVYLDDQLVADDIDTYAATPTYQQSLYSSSLLSPGLHTLRLEVTGDKNPSSVSTLLMLDAIQYSAVPEPASLAVGLVGLTLIAGRRRRR